MKRALLWMLLIRCGGADKAAPTSNVAAAPPPSASASTTADAAALDSGADEMIGIAAAPNLDAGSEVTGANALLTHSAIRRVIQQNFAKMSSCYVIGMRTNPGLAGKITVKFTIGKSGAVTKAEPAPDTTVLDAGVVKCVVDAFGTLVFPKPDSTEVVVAYPLVFTPN